MAASEARARTPARGLDVPLDAGVRVIDPDDGEWVDGGEAEISAILAASSDRSSLSDELAGKVDSWVTRYHFSRERGNIVRAFGLGDDSVVLEVGAGCGAVTRCLGEMAGTVDALEPTLARARAARLRTEDLDSVEVFAGRLESIPREPTYDAVVLIGVLEYVGGRDGLEERVRLLREAAARLKDGGAVVCAIENRLGVQYLAGAPEEHLGVPFDGLEDYPRPGPVRTFTRAGLESLFAAAGLLPRVHHVFPDYKFARLLYRDSLLDGPARPLAWRAPVFPSAASPHPRGRLASEERLWRGLVDAGLGGELANSFLAIGTASGESHLWPGDLDAAFFSTHRRAGLATVTRVLGDGERPSLERRALGALTGFAGSTLHRVRPSSPWVGGTPLSELLADADGPRLDAWMRRWHAHVEADEPTSDGRNIDLGPHNILVDGDTLRTIDEEFYDGAYSTEDVLARGLLHATLALADRRAPESWPDGCATVADTFGVLAEATGGPVRAGALPDIVRRESELLVRVSGIDPDDPGSDGALRRQIADFSAALERPLAETALARRSIADLTGARDAELAKLHALAEQQHHEIDRLHREVAIRDARVAELEAAAERSS